MPVTQNIINAIQAYLVSSNLYKVVELGAIKDWSDVWPLAEVMFLEDDSTHWSSGGTIKDTQGFRVTTAICYSTTLTPPQATAQLIAIRDAIMPVFQQHAYLGGITGVSDSRIKPGSTKISFITDNGNDYLVHEFIVEVRQKYSVPIGASGI